MTAAEGFMEGGLYERLIDEIASHSRDTKVVLFFRGESLLHPHFKHLLSYACDRGLWDVSLATNAMFLDRDMSDYIIVKSIRFIS